MKFKQKKSSKSLSDKIADALTVKAGADIEDDQVFGTKPKILSRVDYSSSESEDDAAISDFRKRNVNLLSEISKKYDGQVVSRKNLKEEASDLSEGSKDFEGSDIESDEENSTLKSPSKSKGPLASDTEDSDIEYEEPTPKKSTKKQDTDSESDDEEESEDYSITQFKKQIAISDNEEHKPTPKKGTKKQDIDSESDDGEESEDYSITQFKKQIADSDDDSEGDGDEEADDDEDDDGEGYDISQFDEPMPENFEHIKKQNISEEAKKGGCVRNQLLLWEGLLEMRIHLQRCVTTANQMPLPETHEELKASEDFGEECNTTKANVTNVLDKLLNLQSMLLKKFPETKSISTSANKKSLKEEKQDEKKPESDKEIPSDTEDEEIPSDTEEEDNMPKEEKAVPKSNAVTPKKRKLEEYEKDLAVTHKSFKSFRDSTIQKWNDKTRLATAASIKNAPSNTILQQISYILSDRNKLVRRTQLKRSEYDIIGYKSQPSNGDHKEDNGSEINPVTRDRKDDDEYIAEIFDDSDFYHQLLRELIECKSADISDPVQLSRQWIALQQMRSKMKRKVDTKATKGRKIKYVVHNPLVNYMAPEKSTTWTEESANELYTSLFGKLFENNNVGLNANLQNGFKIK